MKNLQYLLLQARKENDPMIKHEKNCFIRSLQCQEDQIKTKDLIRNTIQESDIDSADIIIIGGSGDFSIAKGGPWLKKVLNIMNDLYEKSKITFASCWGFQAMARARGGIVIHDLKRAELGTTKLHLTEEGKKDKIFKNLPDVFLAQMGHEDIVEKLPAESILLASSLKVKNEAFKFIEKPIYCTQFHPELNKNDLKQRMLTYPEYIEKTLGISQVDFINKYCKETHDTDLLIVNFIQHFTTR